MIVPLAACGDLLGVTSDSNPNPNPNMPPDAGDDVAADAPAADAPFESGLDAGTPSLCDGGGLCTISSSEPAAYGIAVDDDYVYWTLRPSSGTGAVRRWSKATGIVETFHPATQGAASIALSATDVFWTVDGSPPAGAVQRKPKSAPSAASVLQVTGQANPRGLAVDGTSVAWSVQSTSAGEGLVRSVPTSTFPSNVHDEASGLSFPLGIAMDAQYIYYGETSGSAPARRSARGAASVESSATVGDAYAFALAGASVFIARGSGGVVYLDQATFTTAMINSVDSFATAATPCAIAASGSDVVWVSQNTYVRRANATSPMMSNLTFVSDGSEFECIAIDGTSVYWTWQRGAMGGVYAYPFDR